MIFDIRHTTRYRYSAAVTVCHNEAHLRPRPTSTQRCLANELTVDPAPVTIFERTDYFGNPAIYFAVQNPHSVLTVTAASSVALQSPAPADFLASCPWDQLPSRLRSDASAASIEAREFAFDSPLVPLGEELAEFARPSFQPERPLLDAVHDLSKRLHREFVYDPNFTTVATPLLDVLAQRRGVCQDFAHLAIGCVRSMGLPARYVSGYVESVPVPGQPRRPDADASHAWFAVFDPSVGWVDFDPTNDRIVGEQHATLAWGRDYSDVTPLKGVAFGGGMHTLEVMVDVVTRSDT